VSLGLAPAFLAACSSGEQKASGGDQGSVDGGTIDFLSWQGYDLRSFMEPWEKSHNVSFKASFIANHDDIQAKVKQSPGTYNLISYYQGYHQFYKDLKVVSPLDRDLVPNYAQNYPMFKGQSWWESDGQLWGVPFTFGSWTLNYNPAEMSRPTKWTDLLDPKFKNRIAVLDDPNGAIVIGGLILGFPVPRLTQDHVDKIIDLFRRFRRNARAIAPSPGDLTNMFASKEIIAVVPGYTAINAFGPKAGVKLDYIVPDEGSASFCDAWAIPPDAKSRASVHAWINQTLTPEGQVAQAEELSAGVVQPSAVPKLKAEQRQLFPYDDLEGWFEKAPLKDLPPQEPGILTYQQWIDAWAAFKAETP
jgi:spermidine/putrescine transport system substrate-binding protein